MGGLYVMNEPWVDVYYALMEDVEKDPEYRTLLEKDLLLHDRLLNWVSQFPVEIQKIFFDSMEADAALHFYLLARACGKKTV